MFTGLVEGQGVVAKMIPETPGIRLAIIPPAQMSADCAVGDSIAINGCCLTVVRANSSDDGSPLWEFQAGPETLEKTNVGLLHPGVRVNLERSLPVQGRVGGHFVQGHVDGVGSVQSVIPTGEWVTIELAIPAALARQMVPKGSVAVDGVSLTLVTVERERFSVALIPHTLEVTTLGLRQPGDTVNIETDILAKYVQKLMGKE